ncbi:MAG: hypothetical protein JRL30_21340, partial [Deltaproteobacteria bacterium]|nr:hypothetical protein [Deltaproteobacteria bacterium]
MLTDFFLVTEQDTMPSESLRHPKGKIADMPEKWHGADETPGEERDFHSTFVSVSQHGDSDPSETVRQMDSKMAEGDRADSVPSKIKKEADTKPKGDDIGHSVSSRKDATKMPGKEGPDDAGAKPVRAAGKTISDVTKGVLPHGPETPKGPNPAKLDMQAGSTRSDSGTPGTSSILSDTARAKGHSGLIHHESGRGSGLMVPVSSETIAFQAGKETKQNGFSDLNIDMAGAREKGPPAPAGASNSSRKIANNRSAASDKRGLPELKTVMQKAKQKELPDLKMAMTGAKEKGTPAPAGAPDSSRKIANNRSAASDKTGLPELKTVMQKDKQKELPDLKMAMTGAKEKETPAPAGASNSSRKIANNRSAASDKRGLPDLKMAMTGAKERGTPISASELGSSRRMEAQASYGAQTVRQPDRGNEQASLKTIPGGKVEVVLSHGEGLRPQRAFAGSGKERNGKDYGGPSRKRSGSREIRPKSSHSNVRSRVGVGEGQQAEKGRHREKGSRFDLTQDAQEKSYVSKAKSEDSAVETTREKKETGFSAIKLASRGTTHASEHGFDRSVPKPEMNTADNGTMTAGNTSSSTKTDKNIARFGEMEMVRRSFQDNGLKQLVEKAALNLKNGQQEFRIELKPELLGQV